MYYISTVIGYCCNEVLTLFVHYVNPLLDTVSRLSQFAIEVNPLLNTASSLSRFDIEVIPPLDTASSLSRFDIEVIPPLDTASSFSYVDIEVIPPLDTASSLTPFDIDFNILVHTFRIHSGSGIQLFHNINSTILSKDEKKLAWTYLVMKKTYG
ncbi:hypothetical protein CHS0354_009823 [Potamilus streckersoni]|uniref:Uncharacterized protein n=1 Tax=Potamilus streckersoni TaxID=2493646 RepID=A0AAE0SXA7_9BIVA|nr:hypothetical protein CHS0354_009823 [Potamilus streckersoni]